MAGAAASSEPPASETPRDATGERAEPRAVAADSLPATATTPPRSAPPRQSSRVFLAPVEDAPHSEHAVSFLLDHLAREGDVVHLLVVVPATHPSSALAYGGPMVPRVAQPPRSCAKPSLTCFAFFFSCAPRNRRNVRFEPLSCLISAPPTCLARTDASISQSSARGTSAVR